MQRNIILIGFMGTGKSTVGKKLAASLNFEFVDTDVLIEESAGVSIPEIFAREGESRFRELEAQALAKALKGQDKVISTGGGIVLRYQNRNRMRKKGYCVWLKARPDTIFQRVSSSSDRPLLRTPNPRQTIEDLMEKRRPNYAATAHLEIVTDDLRAEDVAYGISESAKLYFHGQESGGGLAS